MVEEKEVSLVEPREGDDLSGKSVVEPREGGNPTGKSGSLKEEEEHHETEASFRRKLFENEPHLWDKAAPITIRNLTVHKDMAKRDVGKSPELPGPPNFFSAIIGSWLTKKLGCMGPPPQSKMVGSSLDGESSISHAPPPSPNVVTNISAVLNPGEATLVISPSSSGKTTLMRTIAHLCEGREIDKKGDKIEGTVRIGGINPADPQYEGCFRRCASFADQGDLTLTPVLKVDETIRFSQSCTSRLTPEELDAAVAANLRIAGLSHVAGTVVGNAEIRGVSGGQKRRVKVLETASGGDLRAVFLDEITNGLDSASALASCQNINVAVEKTGITAMTCLLQPSVDMYRQFHRIIVLTQRGEMIYSGPRDAALAHFESVGLSKPEGMDEPEFFLRCAFKPADFARNKEDEDVTITSSEVASLFANSQAGRALEQDLNTAESTKPKQEPTVVQPFARSTWKQLSLLLGRGFKLVLRNPGTYIRVFFAVIFGLFVGTLFLNTPGNAVGTSTRAGYTFTMLMLLFMTAANAPMEGHFADRGTFYCHRQLNFYKTSTYYIADIICSFPVTFMEATLLSVCSFFLVGMECPFLYFLLIAVLLSACGNAVSRVLSFGFPSQNVASALGPACLMVFQMTAGFAPQYPNLPVWLRWLSWLSPCAYALEGLLVNELRKRDIDGTDISGNEFGREVLSIPRINYDSAPPGMDSPGSLMAFDAYMILAFVLFFEFVGCFILHASQQWYGPSTKRFQVAAGMSLAAKPDIAALLNKRKNATGHDETEKSSVPQAPPAQLTALNIVYEVDVSPEPEKQASDKEQAEPKKEAEAEEASPEEDPEEKVLLTAREYGQVGRGRAQNYVLKKAVGEEAMSFRASRSSTASSTAVQEDEQIAAAVDGAAGGGDLEPVEPGRLRLLSGVTASFSPGTMTALMGSSGAGKTTLLDVLAGYKTGGHTTGSIALNKVEKSDEIWRLVAGYCEQTDLHNPAMTVRESLMFAARMRLRPFSLEEEAKVAYCEEILLLLELEEYGDILVGDEAAGQGLPKHARKRLTLGVELVSNPSIMFADEPTSGLDSVSASLVVQSLRRAAKSRGVTVVCTIHQPSREVFEAFHNLLLLRKGGQTVYNGPVSGISQYINLVSGSDEYEIKAGTNPADHALDIFCGPGGEKEDWHKLYKHSDMAKDVLTAIDTSLSGGIDTGDTEERGFFTELHYVLQRQVLSHWRTPTYMAVRFWWTLAATVLLSLIFLDIDETTKGAFDLVGAIFSFVNLGTVPLMSAAVPLISERAVFYREVSSGTYRKYVYGMAIQVAEIPFNFFMAIVAWVIFYWVVRLDSRGDRVVYNLLMTLAAYWVLPLFGQVFAFLSPNIGISSVMSGILLVAFSLTMGFLLRPDEIPAWYIWIYWGNPLRYMLQGLAVNELGDGKVYVNDVTGDLESGDDLLDSLGSWSFDERWWYCYVVVLLFGFVAAVGLLGATRINFVKR